MPGRLLRDGEGEAAGNSCRRGFRRNSPAGARLPFALIVGYSLHGLWDLLHELQAHGAYSAFAPDQLTPIPLAYGVFCAAFDFCMAAYFYERRAEWIAAWKAARRSR